MESSHQVGTTEGKLLVRFSANRPFPFRAARHREKTRPLYAIRRLIIQSVAFARARNRPRRRRRRPPRIAMTNRVVTLVGDDEPRGPGPRRSRAVQGRQGRRTVRTAEHKGRTHRRPATSGAVPVELKVAEVAAVHPAIALVHLALLLQRHTPPFRPRVLEPDLGTRPAQGSAVLRYASHCLSLRCNRLIVN